jgi:uncharacterized membrane protein YhhN
MFATGVVLCAAGLVATLVSERAREAGDTVIPGWALWVAKPLASLGFLIAAVGAGAVESAYGVTVLVALVLCMAGDVLLIPRGASRLFLYGLVAFLLGHAGFAVAFFGRGIDPTWTGTAAVALVPVAAIVMRWLWPNVPDKMRGPVIAYVVVISTMVATAVGAFPAAGDPRIVVGATLFWLSDLAVARQRFVAPGFTNRLWGLPTYYSAQVVLAWSVAFA